MALDDLWKYKGACNECPQDKIDETFFPPEKQGITTKVGPARAFCNHCEVRGLCLAYAVFHSEPHGVWGGMSVGRRKRIDQQTRQRLRLAWLREYPQATPSHASRRAS